MAVPTDPATHLSEEHDIPVSLIDEPIFPNRGVEPIRPKEEHSWFCDDSTLLEALSVSIPEV
jgi:hypothetical protein